MSARDQLPNVLPQPVEKFDQLLHLHFNPSPDKTNISHAPTATVIARMLLTEYGVTARELNDLPYDHVALAEIATIIKVKRCKTKVAVADEHAPFARHTMTEREQADALRIVAKLPISGYPCGGLPILEKLRDARVLIDKYALELLHNLCDRHLADEATQFPVLFVRSRGFADALLSFGETCRLIKKKYPKSFQERPLPASLAAGLAANFNGLRHVSYSPRWITFLHQPISTLDGTPRLFTIMFSATGRVQCKTMIADPELLFTNDGYFAFLE